MRWFLRLLALLLAFSTSGVSNAGADVGCEDESGDCSDCAEHCQCACCPLPAQLALAPGLVADPPAVPAPIDSNYVELALAAVTADIFHPPRA